MAKSANKKRKVTVEPVGEAYINASLTILLSQLQISKGK